MRLNPALLRRVGANTVTVAVAGVAGTSTWQHIVDVGQKYGEPMAVALPVSIDGMMIVGTLMISDAAATGRRAGPWPWVAAILGGLMSIGAQIESGRERGWAAAAIATVFSVALIITVGALFHKPRTRSTVVAVTAEEAPDISPLAKPDKNPARSQGKNRTGRPAKAPALIADAVSAAPQATATELAAMAGVSDRHTRRVLNGGTSK